jgi:hypothetical protein
MKDLARVARRDGKRYCMPMRLPGRHGAPSTLILTALALFLALLPAAAGAEAQVPIPAGAMPPQVDPPDDRIRTTKVEGTIKEKKATIQVYCFSRSARLWIDRKEVDWIPYKGDLDQGSHYIEVRIPGYYPLGHWFFLAEKKFYTLEFTPTQITGSIRLDVEPKDAKASVDGTAVSAGLVELPVGKHRLDVSRFGYASRSLDLDVREKTDESVSVALDKAAFAVGGLAFSREAFNPRSLGRTASAVLEFRATGPGSARVEIHNAEGERVALFEFPAIEGWQTRRVWDGLDANGSPLPEGMYVARLVAKGEDADGEVEAEARVWIDSSLVVRAFGTAAALTGLLYMPDPVPAASGTAAVEAFVFIPPQASWSSSGDAAFGLAAGFSVAKGVALGLHASAELGDEPFGSGDFDGSALFSILGDKTSAWSGGLFLRGGYSSLELPAMPGAGRLVEVSLPVGARLGSIARAGAGADVRLAVAPGVRADFSGATAWLALGRAALWLEGKRFRAGLSGELPLSLDGRVSLYRGAGAALEGRFALGSFVAAAYATADFAAGEAPAFGYGLGLGLLF